MDDVIEKLKAMCAVVVNSVEKKSWDIAQVECESIKELIERCRIAVEAEAALKKQIAG